MARTYIITCCSLLLVSSASGCGTLTGSDDTDFSPTVAGGASPGSIGTIVTGGGSLGVGSSSNGNGYNPVSGAPASGSGSGGRAGTGIDAAVDAAGSAGELGGVADAGEGSVDSSAAGAAGSGTSKPPTVGSKPIARGSDPTADAATKKGPYAVKTIAAGLPASADIGSQTLYYPSDAAAPFASVVIAPGFLSAESSIQAWGPFLASHGIVTLTVGTKTGTEAPDVRAKALLEGASVVQGENARSGSPLQGKMAIDRIAIMGWSMGGGGTLIAANEHPQLKAAITLAAWNPGVQFDKDQVPTLLLAGGADAIAGGQSQGFYQSIPGATPKMLFEVAGGSHNVGNDPTSAKGEIGRYGLSWLKVFLEGDTRYRQFLLQTPSQQSDFQNNLSP